MAEAFYLMRMNGPYFPRRGDLMQTAVGTKRERTWFIWFVRRTGRDDRYRVLRVRWWEIDPETRVALWRSAERAGGQHVWNMEERSRR